jgi:hypothetical protein
MTGSAPPPTSAASLRERCVIGVTSLPNSHRFQSLRNDEEKLDAFAPISWVSQPGQMTSLIIPPRPTPLEVQVPALLCEEDLETSESPRSGGPTPESSKTAFDSCSDLTYQSLPIIDKATQEAQTSTKQLAYAYAESPPAIFFLEIQQVLTRVTTGCVDLYVMDVETPFTEVLHINLSGSPPVMSSYRMQGPSAILPFPEHNAVLLGVYYPDEPGEPDYLKTCPTRVGRCSLGKMGLAPYHLYMPWYKVQPGVPLQTQFTEGEVVGVSFDLQFKVQRKQRAQVGKTCRLTAIDAMFPSRLLTLWDIRLEFPAKAVDPATRIYVAASLRKTHDTSKESKDVPAFVRPDDNQIMEVGFTAQSLVHAASGDKCTYLAPMNFMLDPTLQDNVTLYLEVFAADPNKKRTDPKKKDKSLAKFPAHDFTKHHEKELLRSKTGGWAVAFCACYPVVCAPSQKLYAALANRSFKPDRTDPMCMALMPYVVQQRITVRELPYLEFTSLNKVLKRAVDLGLWMEHYFTPEPAFALQFTAKVTENIAAVARRPIPFLMLIFKAMRVGNAFDAPSLARLFAAIAAQDKVVNVAVSAIREELAKAEGLLRQATSKTEAQLRQNVATVKTRLGKFPSDLDRLLLTAGHLLMQLFMSWDVKNVHALAYGFLSGIAITEWSRRLVVYDVLFSDMAFVQSLTLFEVAITERPGSPYRPLLSLFYQTVTEGFKANDQDQLKKLARTLTLLATTVEQFAIPSEAKTMAQTLFPLLPIIFTFFDSMKASLGEDTHVIAPILLFIFKNVTPQQFLAYFNMLMPENQPVFFDFLEALVDPKMILGISQSCQSLSVKQAPYEITSRIAVFAMSFAFQPPEVLDHMLELNALEKFLGRIFTLLTRMLNVPYQASQSFHFIFLRIAFFVNQFVNEIFVRKTALATVIMTPVIQFTNLKSLSARNDAIGFIQWIVDKEWHALGCPTKGDRTPRCQYAIEYAVSTNYLGTADGNRFWESLPPELRAVTAIYERWESAVNESVPYEDKVSALLGLYDQFTNVPAIRATIYHRIIKIHVEQGDFCSAFVAQWKLSDLIRHAFDLKNQEIKGIPRGKPFPYIVNEPKVDLSVHTADSSYLVLESSVFTETGLCESMKGAMDLAAKAGLYWLLGDVTDVLFKYLETQRQFGLLTVLYGNMTKPFEELKKSERPCLGFARIFASGVIAERLKYDNVIHLFQRGADGKSGFQAFQMQYSESLEKKHLRADLRDDGSPFLTAPRPNSCQICQVKPSRTSLTALAASEFCKDVIGEDHGWDKPFVKRFVFTTKSPMPGCAPVVAVVATTTTDIIKSVFFVEKLTKFIGDLRKVLINIEEVLPPPKMMSEWGHTVLGLSAKPIVKFMKKIRQATPEKHPYYVLVLRVLTERVLEDTPIRITELIDEIRTLFVHGAGIIERLYVSGQSLPADEKAVLEDYDKFLGEPMDWLYEAKKSPASA